MEASSSSQHLDDSFDRLAADVVVYSFRISTSSSSFIDLYPDQLFSMRWTTATNDFEFDLPVSVLDDGSGTSSPTLQVSASRIFRSGHLLPCDHGDGSGAQEEDKDLVISQYDTADVPSPPPSSAISSPVFHSAPSTPVPLSPRATSKHARPRSTTTLCAERRRTWALPWKVLRFMMPLCGKLKVRAIVQRHSRVVTSEASMAPEATPNVRWCHGRADTDVHDAILYCNKSSGQHALPTMKEANRMSAE